MEILDKHISGTYFRGYLNPEWNSAVQKLAEFFRDDASIWYVDASTLEFLKQAFSIAGREFSCVRTHDVSETLAQIRQEDDSVFDFAEHLQAPICPAPTYNDTPAFGDAILLAQIASWR